MKVFVTGGSGYVGEAIVRALALGHHHVSALARSEASAKKVEAAGARAVRGDITEDAWKAEASTHDALVHAAVDYGDTPGVDRRALDTLLGAAAMPGAAVRSFAYTSGVWVLGNTGDAPADEGASVGRPIARVAWRPAYEQRVVEAATGELFTAVIRPGIVWGGRGGIIGDWFDGARKDGRVTFVGDGENRWPFIHASDNAALYVRVLEQRAAGIFHAVDGLAPRVADAARAASEAAGCGGATHALPLEDARKTMGGFADALCADQVVVARRATEIADWSPYRRDFVQWAKSAFAEHELRSPI